MTNPKQKKTLRAGRGTLTIILALFVTSASVRLVHGANSLANATPDTAPLSKPSDVTASQKTTPPTDAELEPILRAFEAREAKISEQEKKISQRMEMLAQAERTVSNKLEELRKAEAELRSTLALASSAAEDDLSQLTAVYETMKPKTAAALFEEMAPEFAAGFLARMRSDSAANIMAGLKPETAYAISAILAGRNSNVPKE